MNDNVSTGFTVLILGVLGLIWAIFTVRRDLNKPGFKSRNFMIALAGIGAIVIAAAGVARMLS